MPSRRSVTPAAVPPTSPKASQPSAAVTPTKRGGNAQSRTAGSSAASSSLSSSSGNPKEAQQILQGVWNRYVNDTPQRVKLVDVFLVFLAVVGVLQFAYCVLAGNYPFNAFLSGFSATVGQFVLTVSLRIQSDPSNKGEFKSISPERAFADYVLGSLILHFFCVNFIN